VSKSKKSLPSIIDMLEFRRDQYGVTAKDWAFILGISAQHYSEFVNGRRELPKKAMGKAYEYGVPAEALFQCYPTKHIGHIHAALKSRKAAA